MLPPLPPTPAAAAAALASPDALPALIDAILSGGRCRDGGVQAATAALDALADAVSASAPPLPPHAHAPLSTLLSARPAHPHRAARAATLASSGRLAAALAGREPALAASALPALRAGLGDAAPEVREAAVSAAAGVGAGSPSSLAPSTAPLLLAGAADADAGVAAAAVAGLAGLRGSERPPTPAWPAWCEWGATAGLPCLRPLVAAASTPTPPLPPGLLPALLAGPPLSPPALWGLTTLAGPAALNEHAGALLGALDASTAASASSPDPALLFAAQAAGAALPPATLIPAAFGGQAANRGRLTVRTCLLYGLVVSGQRLGAAEEVAATVAAWLEGWWEEQQGDGAAAAAWPLLQAAGLAARACGDRSAAAAASRLWSLTVQAAVAVRSSGGGPAAAAAVARLVADLCPGGGEACQPAAWGTAAVAARLASCAATPSPAALASLESILLAMAESVSLHAPSLASVLGWVEGKVNAAAPGLDPPARRSLLRLVGRLAASPGGSAAFADGGGANDDATLADRAVAAVILPCLTQSRVGGGGVRAAGAVAAELVMGTGCVKVSLPSLASALADRARSDADATARAAACSALGALLALSSSGRCLPAAGRDAALAALAAALDDAGGAAVRVAAADAVGGLGRSGAALGEGVGALRVGLEALVKGGGLADVEAARAAQARLG